MFVIHSEINNLHKRNTFVIIEYMVSLNYHKFWWHELQVLRQISTCIDQKSRVCLLLDHLHVDILWHRNNTETKCHLFLHIQDCKNKYIAGLFLLPITQHLYMLQTIWKIRQFHIYYPYKSSSVKISIDSLTSSDISSNFFTSILVGFECLCRCIGEAVVS